VVVPAHEIAVVSGLLHRWAKIANKCSLCERDAFVLVRAVQPALEGSGGKPEAEGTGDESPVMSPR